MSPRRFALPFLAAILVVVLAILFLPTLVGGPGASTTPSPSGSTAASDSGSPAELRQVRLLLGFQPDVQFAPFYLAQQGGYFADAGLEVTIEHSDDVIPLVADGQAEFGVADATDVMIARTSGIPIKYVSTLYNRFPVALIGAPDVLPNQPADLAGLRIGTPGQFGSSWHALLALLDAGGLTPDDVTIRDYPQFNQVEGLLNGDVDLITGFRTNEPLRLEAQGFEVELMTVDDFAPLPGPGIVVGDELLADDIETAHAFARAIAQAQVAIAGNSQLGLDAAIAEVPAIAEDPDTAEAVLLATVEAWGSSITGAVVRDVWSSGYETLRRLGFIDGSVPVEEMYDLRVVASSG
ncbi:MAG TPA: ABC transporter substrate-binding protein [Candidatus Limnocylindria bacterium]|nr:ABC transporter substrate-binding protein [Candidatus Limnocylindria bacterium]